MTPTAKHGLRLCTIGLLLALLGGCAVVPYNPPGHYGYRERSYAPVVPVPIFIHRRHHHHRW